jgi:hypothetical protein
MTWLYKGKKVTEVDLVGYVAFTYVIQHKETGKRYFGKKRLRRKVKRKPLKGKKRVRVSYTESDWQTYYGSNEALQREVEEQGGQAFIRTILRLCKTLSESSYYEAKVQFEHDVLLHPDKFYNEWISCRLRSSHFRKK